MLPDALIARRAANGSERAFAAIFERYHQDLYRYCAAILGNSEDAHDAVQNTMLKVLRSLPGEQRQMELKPWLYRIAHNEAIDMIRARKRTEPIDAEALAGAPGPAEEAETRRRLRQLVADIAELPARQRGALVMRELSGLGYEQIGEALQTSAAAARQTTYEARLSLRRMSEEREMACREVMRAISDDDGRVLRRRDIRAHLQRCEDCRAFRAEISGRRREFAALAPLPAVASAGILQSLLGGAVGGANGAGGAAGAAAGKALAGPAAIKAAAAVLVVSAVGVVAANRGGMIDLGSGGHREAPARTTPGAGNAQAPATSAAGAFGPHAAMAKKARRSGGARPHRQVGQGSATTRADHASAGAPISAEPAAEQVAQSHGRHLGKLKSSGAANGKPEHPAKGKKSPGAPPGQSKSPGQAKHNASGAAGAKPHPTHPDHPVHPGNSPAAHPEAAAPGGGEAANGEHRKPMTE
jgi:RNA polymerase sigma factor (sigma-70 family)